MCGIIYFPWHRHQIEGTDSFLVSLSKVKGHSGRYGNLTPLETLDMILHLIQCWTIEGHTLRTDPGCLARYAEEACQTLLARWHARAVCHVPDAAQGWHGTPRNTEVKLWTDGSRDVVVWRVQVGRTGAVIPWLAVTCVKHKDTATNMVIGVPKFIFRSTLMIKKVCSYTVYSAVSICRTGQSALHFIPLTDVSISISTRLQWETFSHAAVIVWRYFTHILHHCL